MFKNKTLLITGGTGSFGKNFLFKVQSKYKSIKKVIIFSRDELKQYELSAQLDKKFKEKVRFFLGDIRDKSRLSRALEGVDIIIHAAALKHVPAAEYDPFEFINTNIIGAQNIIECAIDKKVQKIVALSTDKASSPVNLYGATKLCSDKLFVAANNLIGNKKISFSVVRYGNVFGSRGSVLPLFLKLKKRGLSPSITDPKMTRFNITLRDSIEMVEWVLNRMKGGEIFVPKIPSYKIIDLVEAVFGIKKYNIIGIRPGEKIHEEMIPEFDLDMTYDLGKYYTIVGKTMSKKLDFYLNFKKYTGKKSYNSLENKKFVSVNELKNLVKKYTVDETF